MKARVKEGEHRNRDKVRAWASEIAHVLTENTAR